MERESLDRAAPATVAAVILGASEFPYADALPASPAFAGSASAFIAYLKSERGLRLSDSQVLDLFDSDGNVIEQNDRLTEYLLRNQDATDLVVYYVGHGGFLPDREYFLALRSTKRGAESLTGLRIRALAHALEEHFPGKRVFLILDCCFAGEAVAEFQSDEIGTIVENKTFDALPETGTSLLVAASKDEPAISPTGAAYTMFSDCFLEVLAEGIAGSQKTLSLIEVGEVVQQRIRTKFGQRGVRPEIHSPRQGEGDVAKIPLFPNPAYTPRKPKALPAGIDDALGNPLADIRAGAIRPLAQLMASGDQELAGLARAALERLSTQDDSRSVQERAATALGRREVRERPAPRPEPPPERKRTPTSTLPATVAIIVVLAVSAGIYRWYPGQGDSPEQSASPTEPIPVEAPPPPPAPETIEAVPPPPAPETIEAVPSPPASETVEAVPPPPASDVETVGELEQPGTVDEETLTHQPVKSLLADAESYLQQDQLTTPKGSNAVERYRAVLERDPDNQAAQSGLGRVVDRYVALATSAIAGQKFAKAQGYLAKAESIESDNAKVQDAHAQLVRAQDTARQHDEIQRKLADAEHNFALSGANSAKGNDAVVGYRGVLALDPDNQAALAGLDKMLRRYLTLAKDSLARRDFDGTAKYLTDAGGIDAANLELASVRADLEKAQATPSRLSFAVFPFQSRATCHYSVRDDVTDAADAAIRDQPRATLDYSYYAAGADGDAIPDVFKLWSDNAAQRQPVLETVRKAGGNLGVNGVLMVWFICSRSQNVAVDRYEVEVYLIDVNQDRVFHSKMNFLDAGRAIPGVFDQFYAAYGIAGG